MPRPYAGLSFVNYERAYPNLGENRINSLRRAVDYAHEAIRIDPQDPMRYWAMSRAKLLAGNPETARESVATATDLNPSYAAAQYFLGWVAMQLGEHASCVERVDLALRLSPFDPLVYGMHGVSAMSLSLMDRHEQAVDKAHKALEHRDMHHQAHAITAAIFALAGERDLARQELQQVRAVNPGYDAKEFFSTYAFQNDDDVRRITQAINQTACDL